MLNGLTRNGGKTEQLGHGKIELNGVDGREIIGERRGRENGREDEGSGERRRREEEREDEEREGEERKREDE